MLAFTYILITVIVALEVPLAITLQKRALAELETRSLAEAQAVAASIGTELVQPAARGQLDQLVAKAGEQTGARIIVVSDSGTLIADSAGTESIGDNYNTAQRPEIQQALGTPPEPSTIVRHSGALNEDLLAVAVPIIDETTLAGGVRLTLPMTEVDANVRRTTIGLIVIGLAGLVAGLLIALALADSMSRPLTKLAAAAQRLGSGDLTARAGNIKGPREVEDVAHEFDDMAEQLQDAMQAQRDFVHNASHQLRTPLTGMKLRLESATDAADSPQMRRQLEAAEKEVDRLSAIVNKLLPGGKPADGAATNLAVAATNAVARWRARAEQRSSNVVASGPAVFARTEDDDVDQILDNLIDNAITYAPGLITVTTASEDGQALFTVEDEGEGIPADEIGRVTERFYRGQGSPPGGSGLGLAIVRELAERWEGTVEVSAASGGGTRVRVRLPLTKA